MQEAVTRAVEECWEARIPAVVRCCHKASYGHLYCADGMDLLACHLAPAEERVTYSDGDWPDRYYTPRTLKCPEFFPVLSERPSVFFGPTGLRLVSFGEGAWWK